jgi:tetratricopeptide (TPR) repeat protein
MSTNQSLQDLLNRGSALVQAGHAQEAQVLADQLLGSFGDHPEVRFFASDVASLRGDASAALLQLDALSDDVAATPRALLRKAQLLMFDGRRGDALDCARTVDLLEADERQLVGLSRVFIDGKQLNEARNCLLIARDKYPASQQILYLLAVSEAQLDRLNEAEKHLSQLLEKSPFHVGALHLRSQLRSWSEDNNHVAALRALLEKDSDPQLAALVNYALGKELEDLQRYEEAFSAYSAGARTYRGLVSYDPAIELSAQQDIRDTVTRARCDALAPGCDRESPIFLVGMPRSGIRLLERVLRQHSDISSVGDPGDFRRILGVLARDAAPAEVSDAEATLAVDFADLGKRYIAAARESAGDTPRFVDCTSYNFLYCGHILAALPEARIIHMQRNPLDVCYSAFKTLIFGAHSFSYDLEELVDYYLSYRAQMQHWHSLFPGQILDVSYEALLQDPEQETRRVLDFCDLPWQEGMLESDPEFVANIALSASATLPRLHRNSLGAAARAGTGLDALRSRLQEAGVPLD